MHTPNKNKRVFTDMDIVCIACLSTDRKLYKLLRYKDVFYLICKNIVQGINSEIFLCFECLALLRNVKNFQVKVQTSQYILKNLKGNDDKQRIQISLSNLSSISTDVHDCSYSLNYEVAGDTKPDLVIKQEDDEDDQYPDDNTCNYDLLLVDETNIYNQSDLNNEPFVTAVNLNEEHIKKETLHTVEDEHNVAAIKNEIEIRDEGKQLQSDSICPQFDKKVTKKKKMYAKRLHLNKDRSELYKFICLDYPPVANVYQRLKIPYEDVNYWLAKERNSIFFKRLKYKCEKCAKMIVKKNLQDHARRHATNSDLKYTCDYCSLSFKRKVNLMNHLTLHTYVRCCKFCDYKCISTVHMYSHVRKQHTTPRRVQCLQCKSDFQNTRLFYNHYHKDHYKQNKTFICDHCNKQFAQHRTIEQHIFKNHTTHTCSKCSLTFKRPSRLKQHYELKHRVARTEASYCVECDRQFDNVPQYQYHIRTAVAHQQERKSHISSVAKQELRRINEPYRSPSKRPAQCLACPKVYSKRQNMMNHYNKVHLGQSKYRCNVCDKMFINNTRLQSHIKYSHEGHVRERNDICAVCGRGFTCKKVLQNHMRTHTGERPFACPHCDSKFAQRTAMVTHVKNIHKKM
ncbi:hypothetical protein O0L34_g15811 [Tuta absoluta]|nr:hypothetical protein O0L34_g15811 [Tuta absoluta]